MNKFLTSKELKNIYNVSTQTLYNWRKFGKLNFIKVNNKKILYDSNNIIELLKPNEEKINIIYARVSNTKQKEDLIRQEEILRNYCVNSGNICHKSITDIASGMNENRNGLNELIQLVIENKVNKIFISYKDRLTRFGYGYFETFFKKFNTEIIILNSTKEEDFQGELTNDLISIIHHFSMKLYSKRRETLKLFKKELEKEC